MAFLTSANALITNALDAGRRTLSRYWPEAYNLSTKHNYYSDFGWKADLCFADFHRLYTRNSIAAAAVDKTVAKTWESLPALWEQPDKPADTELEKRIAEHFEEIGLWRALMQVDRRGIVGAYAGAILLIRDGKALSEPVARLSRIEDIAGVIPAWEGQLEVAKWDDDQRSETYAQPLMYHFNERAVRDTQAAAKPTAYVPIHPSRILIWSEDGTLDGRSDLEPAFNDFVDLDKIKGSGGEGFYKSARGTLIIEAPANSTSVLDIQRLTGAATPDEAKKQLDEKVDDLALGFDKAAIFGGFTAKPLTVTIPQPKEFVEASLQSIAASMQMPVKVLIGNVTGERSSTEDAKEWSRTCMSRRVNLAIPQIRGLVRRLVAWGALPDRPWEIGWASLLDATPDEQLDRAVKMASINSQAKAAGELVFLPDEVRETAGFAPSDEVEGWDDFMAEQEAKARELAEDRIVDAEFDEVPETKRLK